MKYTLFNPDDKIVECKELTQLTPEILTNLNEEINGKIYFVRTYKQVNCPVKKELIDFATCHSCEHYFGDASEHNIYCVPESFRKTAGSRLKQCRICNKEVKYRFLKEQDGLCRECFNKKEVSK